MQSQDELEQHYSVYDPWGYETNPDDIKRRDEILKLLDGRKFHRALDIGCGHGFVTKHINAEQIFGIEISDNAAKYLPPNVTRIHEPEGEYDLIMATGVMYFQYNHSLFYSWVLKHSTDFILIAGISDWLIGYNYPGELIKKTEFNYRQYTQQLFLYGR